MWQWTPQNSTSLGYAQTLPGRRLPRLDLSSTQAQDSDSRNVNFAGITPEHYYIPQSSGSRTVHGSNQRHQIQFFDNYSKDSHVLPVAQLRGKFKRKKAKPRSFRLSHSGSQCSSNRNSGSIKIAKELSEENSGGSGKYRKVKDTGSSRSSKRLSRESKMATTDDGVPVYAKVKKRPKSKSKNKQDEQVDREHVYSTIPVDEDGSPRVEGLQEQTNPLASLVFDDEEPEALATESIEANPEITATPLSQTDPVQPHQQLMNGHQEEDIQTTEASRPPQAEPQRNGAEASKETFQEELVRRASTILKKTPQPSEKNGEPVLIPLEVDYRQELKTALTSKQPVLSNSAATVATKQSQFFRVEDQTSLQQVTSSKASSDDVQSDDVHIEAVASMRSTDAESNDEMNDKTNGHVNPAFESDHHEVSSIDFSSGDRLSLGSARHVGFTEEKPVEISKDVSSRSSLVKPIPSQPRSILKKNSHASNETLDFLDIENSSSDTDSEAEMDFEVNIDTPASSGERFHLRIPVDDAEDAEALNGAQNGASESPDVPSSLSSAFKTPNRKAGPQRTESTNSSQSGRKVLFSNDTLDNEGTAKKYKKEKISPGLIDHHVKLDDRQMETFLTGGSSTSFQPIAQPHTTVTMPANTTFPTVAQSSSQFGRNVSGSITRESKGIQFSEEDFEKQTRNFSSKTLPILKSREVQREESFTITTVTRSKKTAPDVPDGSKTLPLQGLFRKNPAPQRPQVLSSYAYQLKNSGDNISVISITLADGETISQTSVPTHRMANGSSLVNFNPDGLGFGGSSSNIDVPSTSRESFQPINVETDLFEGKSSQKQKGSVSKPVKKTTFLLAPKTKEQKEKEKKRCFKIKMAVLASFIFVVLLTSALVIYFVVRNEND